MEVGTFPCIGIVFSYRYPPGSLLCQGGFSSLTYMLLNIYPARIGIRSHGIQYSIYDNKVLRYP